LNSTNQAGVLQSLYTSQAFLHINNFCAHSDKRLSATKTKPTSPKKGHVGSMKNPIEAFAATRRAEALTIHDHNDSFTPKISAPEFLRIWMQLEQIQQHPASERSGMRYEAKTTSSLHGP
jgi:hypothetical protein